jgi:outer membrane autotransporter protein
MRASISVMLAAVTLIACGHRANAQVFTGDIYPSLGNVQVQNTTTWMQFLSDRLATNSNSVSNCCATNVSCTDGTIFQNNNVQLTSLSSGAGSVNNTCLVALYGDSTSDWSGWAQGYGLGGNISNNPSAGGLNYSLGGTLFGVDRRLDENLVVGAFGGYTGTSMRDGVNGSAASMNDYQFGLYQAYGLDQFYVTNVDAFSNDTYGVIRPPVLGVGLGTASSNSYGNQYSHYTEAGLTLGENGFRLQPFVGLQYLYLNQHGFTESGAPPTNLTSGNQVTNSLRGSLGTRVSQDYFWNGVTLTPSASARYQHEMGDGQPTMTQAFTSAPGVPFSTPGNFLGRDFGLFTIGGNAKLSPNLSLFCTLGAQIASYYSAITGSGGFQVQW